MPAYDACLIADPRGPDTVIRFEAGNDTTAIDYADLAFQKGIWSTQANGFRLRNVDEGAIIHVFEPRAQGSPGKA